MPRPGVAPSAAGSDSDVCDRVAALEDFEASGRVDSGLGRIHRGTAQYVLHVRDQLLRELRAVVPASAGIRAIIRLKAELQTTTKPCAARLLTAFPDRLVRRSGPGSRFGRMVGGRGVRVADSSAVRDAPLFLAVDVDRGESEALVRLASAVERDWLPPEQVAMRTEVEFDAAVGRVLARRRVIGKTCCWKKAPLSCRKAMRRRRSSPPQPPNGSTKSFLGTTRIRPAT